MEPEQVHKAMNFAAAVSALKQALDRNEGVSLTAEDVVGLVWGLQTLRGGNEDAAARTA